MRCPTDDVEIFLTLESARREIHAVAERLRVNLHEREVLRLLVVVDAVLEEISRALSTGVGPDGTWGATRGMVECERGDAPRMRTSVHARRSCSSRSNAFW